MVKIPSQFQKSSKKKKEKNLSGGNATLLIKDSNTTDDIMFKVYMYQVGRQIQTESFSLASSLNYLGITSSLVSFHT